MKTIKQELITFTKGLDTETARALLVGFRLSCLCLEQEALHKMIELDLEGAQKFVYKKSLKGEF